MDGVEEGWYSSSLAGSWGRAGRRFRPLGTTGLLSSSEYTGWSSSPPPSLTTRRFLRRCWSRGLSADQRRKSSTVTCGPGVLSNRLSCTISRPSSRVKSRVIGRLNDIDCSSIGVEGPASFVSSAEGRLRLRLSLRIMRLRSQYHSIYAPETHNELFIRHNLLYFTVRGGGCGVVMVAGRACASLITALFHASVCTCYDQKPPVAKSVD